MIPVTKPFLPPIEEYQNLVSGIWERNWLTNNGPLVQELESKLKQYLDVEHLLFTGNGTIALQMAIKALGLRGEIITTPFSYVATTSSIVWEECTPVFVDIDSDTLNINPNLIEEAITSKTIAILATHVFGNPCDVVAIEKIANKYGLKVIYDGAHAFGTTIHGKSILKYGDISITSFHATKIFHTIEGGALIAKDPELAIRLYYMRNFGHDGPEKYNGIGINGKNSELHAAMGLCNFKYLPDVLKKRKEQYQFYDKILKGLEVNRPNFKSEVDHNYSYYPVIFPTERSVLEAVKVLQKDSIFPRRYFYPSLSKLDYVSRTDTPIADDIASRILCLPLYHNLMISDQKKVVDAILS